MYTGEESSDDTDDGQESKKKKKKAKPKKQKSTAASLRAQDPNTLVEVIRGIYEFYGLIVYLSDWKKGTLSNEDRMELEARQQQQKNGMNDNNDATVGVKEEAPAPVVPAAVSNPYATNKAVPNNPYAKKPPANPYAKAAPANPYAKSSTTVSNPYAKAGPANPYASSSSSSAVKSEPATTTASGGKKPNHHPGSGKELRENSLWADKYAPSSSREILGNADSVNKLNKWLTTWEKNFNNPNKKVKGLTGPNGPFKAALLSGPPGIGTFCDLKG